MLIVRNTEQASCNFRILSVILYYIKRCGYFFRNTFFFKNRHTPFHFLSSCPPPCTDHAYNLRDQICNRRIVDLKGWYFLYENSQYLHEKEKTTRQVIFVRGIHSYTGSPTKDETSETIVRIFLVRFIASRVSCRPKKAYLVNH